MEGIFMMVAGALFMLYGILIKINPQKYIAKKYRDDEEKLRMLENAWPWIIIIGAVTIILGIL